MVNRDPQFGLQPKLIEKLLLIFRNNPRIETVLVYGSRAKGTYRNESDIDLTMKGEKLEWRDLLEIEQAIDDLTLPYKVDLSIYDQIDNRELKAHIDRCGKTFSI